MPRKRKRPIDMTTDEAMRKLFPKKVVDKLKEVAHQRDEKTDEKPDTTQSSQ